MDPQKQKQLINQMFESSAKSEEELSKMNPEERKAYLQGRLKQKMFFSSSQRRSMNQKQQIQEKLQEKLQEVSEKQPETNSKTERNRKKRQKKRDKLKSQKEEIDDDVVVVNNPDSSESDYHSD